MRISKVARTIADLEGADEIAAPHIAEPPPPKGPRLRRLQAVEYRSVDRKLWA